MDLATQTLSPVINSEAKKIEQYATAPGTTTVQAWEDAIEQLNSIRLDSLSDPADFFRHYAAVTVLEQVLVSKCMKQQR
jgi:hypothetical protein